MEEHNNYAVDFINATRWIKANLPTRQGVGRRLQHFSFSFRGNNKVREAMHSAFLYHAIGSRPGHGHRQRRHAWSSTKRSSQNSKFWWKTSSSTAVLTPQSAWSSMGEALKNVGTGRQREKKTEEWRSGTVEERLSHALVRGIDTYIIEDRHRRGPRQTRPPFAGH